MDVYIQSNKKILMINGNRSGCDDEVKILRIASNIQRNIVCICLYINDKYTVAR